jgi:hypothetical protein
MLINLQSGWMAFNSDLDKGGDVCAKRFRGVGIGDKV